MTIAQQVPQADSHLPDIEAAARGLYIDGSWRQPKTGARSM